MINAQMINRFVSTERITVAAQFPNTELWEEQPERRIYSVPGAMRNP